jgi:hypothetical protein
MSVALFCRGLEGATLSAPMFGTRRRVSLPPRLLTVVARPQADAVHASRANADGALQFLATSRAVPL